MVLTYRLIYVRLFVSGRFPVIPPCGVVAFNSISHFLSGAADIAATSECLKRPKPPPPREDSALVPLPDSSPVAAFFVSRLEICRWVQDL